MLADNEHPLETNLYPTRQEILAWFSLCVNLCEKGVLQVAAPPSKRADSFPKHGGAALFGLVGMQHVDVLI